MPETMGFCGNNLDRANVKRRDVEWLEKQLDDEDSRYLPVWRLQPLIKKGDVAELGWARRAIREISEDLPAPVLLGLRDGVAHFALDISSVDKPDEALGLEGTASFQDMRAIASRMPDGEAGVAAQARSLVDWHSRHSFCGGCGVETEPRQGGIMRHCIDCDVDHFPRTDPVVIVVVHRGDRCLLGRSAGFPGAMYSALAGFVEHGENLEEAVRREVAEEANIEVGEVRYIASQPWPFPASLMVGCLAEGLSEAIELDREELADAQWFDRDKVNAALRGEAGDFFVPPPFAIANRLIATWAAGE